MNFSSKALLGGILVVGFSCSLVGAIGDNAPPIPVTFKSAHPRLSSPDSGYLSGLAGNSTALASYNATADSWDSTNPQGSWQLRRLVIAYLANKIANPAKAATYLAKITALADLGGTWGPLLYKVDDGAATGTYSLTSASANFLTGCGGASCLGNIVSVNARVFNIVGVPDAHTLTLGQSNPVPSGSGLKIRIVSYYNESDLNIALIYDWLYNDLDTATRTAFMNQLDVLCTEWEENYIGIGASPYNDQFYIELGTFGMLGALTIYQDHPNGTKHMNFMSDVWFNTLLPVWKQVFGPEGGGWHESYSDYVIGSNGNGLNTFITPSLLAWQSATGDPILTRESWVKNFAYFTMYTARPDYLLENIGDTSRAILIPESPALCSLSGLGEIYNDPVIRGWARTVNLGQPMAALDGFEPSTWPFYRPDNKANPVSTRTGISPVRNFPGWGMLFMRTGWGENDTSATLKYGDNFWSHEHFDTGAFTIFSRGLLALDSGSYRSGSLSEHENQYARQTIAHNTLTVTDPADVYPTTFETFDNQGNIIYIAPPNDGGQRRVGTLYNSRFPQLVAPNNLGGWLQQWDYYHMGTLVAYSSTQNYTYTAVDITAAYNNKFSANTPNATNRTYRVQKAVRHMLFIPRGTSAYVIVYDQVNSTNANFVKRWILHSVNQPVINGNRFQITRNELVTSLPYPGLWPQPFASSLQYTVGPVNNAQYQYDGRLYGWMVQPSAATITAVGGPGKEFWVEDPLHPGTGTNWNQCMQGQCAANSEGLGATNDIISPNPGTAPHEPGAWRIEEKPSNPALQDYFLNVMLATTVEDASVPASVTVPAGLAAGNVGATWTEGAKTYTIVLPQSGVGGHITVSGVVDEDLMTYAQQLPASMKVASGTPQSGTAGLQAPQPLAVTVVDSVGNPVANATVHYGVSQGNGYLSNDTATTGTNGQASVTLTLGAGTPGSVTSVIADVNGLAPVQFDISIGSSPVVPALSSLSCAPVNVVSGGSSTCTVTLTSAAPLTGTPVTLLSNSLDVTVPLVVTVPANATSITFTANAGAGTSGEQVTLTAALLLVTRTATLTFAPVVLSGVACSPGGVSPGASTTCTVTLSQPAASGGATVTLSTNSTAITMPPSMQVAAGSATGAFTATVKAGSTSQVAVIGASFGGVTLNTSVTVVVAGGVGTPIPTNTWMTIPTNGFPPAVVGYDNLIYASGVKKFLMWENYHNLTSESNQALLAYDFALNRWDVWALNGNFHSESLPESGHEVGMMQYDPIRNQVISYCCHSGSQGYERPEHTWIFDPVGRVGRDVQTPTMPGITSEGQAVFDSVDSVYVLYDRNAGTWIYDPAKNSWTQMNPNGTPPNTSGYFSGMAYDTANNKIYMFGGDLGNDTYTNDLYTYDVPSNTWTKLSPGGTPPSPRRYPGFAYDSKDNVFLMFSGANSAILMDTWVYNPVANSWSQLTPQVSPPTATQPVYQRLAYDPDDNVFVMVWIGPGGYANGPSIGYANAQTWFFRYSGTGTNVGNAASAPAPSPGSINLNSDAWANEPVLASDGTNLFSGWIETGRPFDSSNANLPHVYANRLSGSQWSALGGSYLALDSEVNGFDEAHAPSMAVIGGSPWISWYKTNNSGTLLPNSLYAKSWNGSSWVGGAVGGVDTTANFIIQSRSQLVGVGNTPYIAFLENDRTCYPWCQYAYVKTWNGTAWTLVGTGTLNRNATSSTASPLADSVSMASDGTHPLVAWTEYVQASSFKAATPPQVYVSTWNGTAWSALGNSLNVNQANWAYDASIAYFGGSPYVAWVERSQTGPAQLFVKSWNGSSWQLIGAGTVNTNSSTGWAFRPSLAADANNLYLAWVEQPSLGQPAQTFVAKLNNNGWTMLGPALNMDPLAGSAERVSLAVRNGLPYAAWGEVKDGSLRQVYVKQWNGSTWATVSGTSAPPPPPPSAPPVVTLTNPVSLATISGTVTVSATATDNVGMASVQFQLDGVNLGSAVAGSGPTYSTFWNTTGSANGSHTLTAIAADTNGNQASSSISVTVNNTTSAGPVVSSVLVTGLSSSGATVSWTSDKASTSQVVYGTTVGYGASSAMASNMVTAHSVSLAGLSSATLYHYQVQSRDSNGNLGASSDFTFTTSGAAPPSGSQTILLLHGDASEISGVKDGSIVTPATAPPGFSGVVVVNGQGSVNFAPAASGNGVFFTNCCANTDNAYYKFTSASMGNIFNSSQGKVSFFLKSRYSFAQRKATASAVRYTFDARDGNGNHLFGFLTQVVSGLLQFTYTAGGVSQYYFVPFGTEDALFGNGVVLNVTLSWSPAGMFLSLNGQQVKSSPYAPIAPNWTASSVFDLGAYEFSTAGGYNSSDDVIDEFSVTGPTTGTSSNLCDINGDGVVNALDVTAAINQVLGIQPCTTADLRKNGKCDAVDVQRVINASLGGACAIN